MNEMAAARALLRRDVRGTDHARTICPVNPRIRTARSHFGRMNEHQVFRHGGAE